MRSRYVTALLAIGICCSPGATVTPAGVLSPAIRTGVPHLDDDFASPDLVHEILRLLRSNLTDDELAVALGRCSIIGRRKELIEKAGFRFWGSDGYGPGFSHEKYSCERGKRRIRIEYYPDDEVCGVAFETTDGYWIGVQGVTSCSWPKTISDYDRRERAQSVLWPLTAGSDNEALVSQFTARLLWLEERDPAFLKALRVSSPPSANL
jgi:hypothetical protein